jgi:hypothetical protein
MHCTYKLKISCGLDRMLNFLVWFSYKTIAHRHFMLYKNTNCQELHKPRWVVARAKKQTQTGSQPSVRNEEESLLQECRFRNLVDHK